MSTAGNNPIMLPADRKDKDGDLDSDTPGTPPIARTDDVEKMEISAGVDKETEKRLLKKLDMRIIPMVCWIYLMNFTDRVLCFTTMDCTSSHRNRSILAMLVSTDWSVILV